MLGQRDGEADVAPLRSRERRESVSAQAVVGTQWEGDDCGFMQPCSEWSTESQ